ncbi:hypothetical protein N2152v2_003688 [Parachlorella kessleri]
MIAEPATQYVVRDPLYSAVLSKQLAALQSQLEVEGALQRREGSHGFGVLHLCCILKWQGGLEAALQAGVPVDLASKSGYSALHLAAYSSWLDGCRILLEHGANAELCTRRGSSMWHLAAQQKDLASLIDAGADPSVSNEFLSAITPLHTAAHHGRVGAMQVLLEAKANPNAEDDQGCSPLQEVFAHPGMRHSEEKLRAMFTLLRNAGADINRLLPEKGYSLLHFALSSCEEESTVELLLKSGVDPRLNINISLNLFDPRSKSTMLHKAVKRGWEGVVESLLSSGADATIRDRDGLQPLHVAVLSKHTGVIKALLKAGADAQAKGPDCYPSFAQWKTKRGMQALQALMEMEPAGGADPLLQLLGDPEQEMSAVDLACCVMPQHIPSVEVFLDFGVRPSQGALDRAVLHTPIMRTVVERPFWRPELLPSFPPRYKSTVQEALRCLARASTTAGVELPQNVVAEILNKMAYPVSQWADEAWLTKQLQLQEGQLAEGDGAAAPAGLGAAAVAAPAGLGAAAAAAGPPAGLAGLMGNIFQQLQQGIQQALGGGEHGDEEAAGPGGGAAGALGQDDHPLPPLGDLLPPGLQEHVVQAQHHAAGPNVHVVQLELNVPIHQLLGPGLLPPAAGMMPQFGVPGLMPFGLPGMPMPGLLPGGLFPPFFMLDDEDSDEEMEGGEDSDDEEGGVPPHAPPQPVHAPLPPQQQHPLQQAPVASPSSARSGHRPQSLPASPDSMPSLLEEGWGRGDSRSDDEDAPGPSARSGSKRSSGQMRYNLRPRDSNKKRKLDWARSQAITAGIRLASFGGLRGCAAARDLAPGDLMLSIPQDALVYEDTIKETDLGAMLLAIPNITVDNLLIIFTMIDRHDPESKWAPLWASLPQAYYTGLSFPAPLVDALAGTAAQLEIQRAQAHLRSQYAATRPLLDMLLAAYPQHLDPAWFEYQAYLWATELWYSYCFEVEFPGRQGSPSVPVMVPFACHVNHSPWPHVVRYGRVNPATRTLDYPVFRHCSQGQQAFLSYGPVPNLKVLCYYGFVIPNNPHDLVMLKLEPPEGELAAQQQAALDRHGLTLEHNLQLLGCLRVIVATPEELLQVVEEGAVPQDGALSPENEVQALATLEAALLTLLEPLYSSQLLQGGAPTVGASPAGDGWDTPEAQQVVAGAAAPCQGQQHPREGGRQQEQQQQEAGGQQQEERQRKQEGEEEGDGEEQQALHVTSHAGVVKCSRRNENGMDDAWEASRHFCEVYVRGQVQILEHSLQEVRRLLAVAEVVS